MDKYEEYFRQAKDKLRFSGVGGVQMPNPDLTANPVNPMKIDPSRRLSTARGWVLMAGSPHLRNKRTSPIKVLDMSSKFIDERRSNEAKKNNQNHDSDNNNK